MERVESRIPPTRRALLGHLVRSRIARAFLILHVVLLCGAIGYYALGLLHEAGAFGTHLKPGEHWSFLDCVYMTVISVSTAGYGETLRPEGLHDLPFVRVYTIVVLLAGMVAGAYFVSSATAYFVEGDLKRFLERHKMLKTISDLRGHYIICGTGNTGRHIAEEIVATGKDVVVIDEDEKNVATLLSHVSNVNSLIGDATADETLKDAGIDHAAGLAAVLTNDKDNLFLTISARQLNPKLRIISKAVDLPTKAKLLRAGADGVVSPQFIGGMRIASELVRPAVVGFLDEMLRAKESPVRFAELTVGEGHVGQRLGELDITARTGLPILAIKKRGTGYLYNPDPDTRLETGAVLVTMGEVARVHKLEQLIGSGKAKTVKIGPPPTPTAVPRPDAPAPQPPPASDGSTLKDPRDPI